MSRTVPKPIVQAVVADDPARRAGRLTAIGGSIDDAFNNVLANQAVQSIWLKNSSPEERSKQTDAVIGALIGIAPRGEMEGMLAAQMIACHNAAIECYRRAMIGEQTFEGRKENLTQANKLSRTYASLLEALNRHRGKGQQKVTVEHVHVHQGGQAVVGVVEHGGDGAPQKVEEQPHARRIEHAPGTPMRSHDPERETVPIPGDAQR